MRERQQKEALAKDGSESDSQEEKRNAGQEPSSLMEKKEENVIDIQSYHSSEENFQRGKDEENIKSKRDTEALREQRSERSLENQEQWEQIQTDEDDSKSRHSLNSGQNPRAERYHDEADNDMTASYHPHRIIDVAGHSGESQEYHADPFHSSKSHREGQTKEEINERLKDDNFWANYEKNLGIGQEKLEEQPRMDQMTESKFKMPNENFTELEYTETPSQQVMQNQDGG